MKTIFITIGEALAARNILRTDFWPEFKEQSSDTKIVIIAPPEKKDYYQEKFGEENIVVESYTPAQLVKYEKLLVFLARNGIDTHTNLWEKMSDFERQGGSKKLLIIKKVLAKILGHVSLLKTVIRTLYGRIPSDQKIVQLFDTYKPDMVFSTILINMLDDHIVREAKRRGIKTVAMVRSWDNLTSHGLLRLVPDVFLLQNKFLFDMAIKHQSIPRKKMRIVGIPHYDLYHYESLLESREEFFNRMGLDLDKKLLLYGAMGDFLFPHEGEIATVLENIINEGKIEEPVQVVFRAHPAFTSPLERMQGMRHVKPDRGAKYFGDNLTSWEMEIEDTKHLINSIYHADIMITGGSTMAIDAAALDKPIICVGFDGAAKDVPYWLSVKRFYDTYTHFEILMDTAGVDLVNTPDELADAINVYIKNSDLKREGRRDIIKLFAEPFDGKAGKRLAEEVAKECNI